MTPPSRGVRVRRGTRQVWLAENEGKHVCHCGCGELIAVRTAHFKEGVPRYRQGHNSRVDHPMAKPPVPATPCECGCGELATPGRRYIVGHAARGRVGVSGPQHPQYGKTGAKSPRWKGGRTVNFAGYVLAYAPEHPFARTRAHYVFEHRLVMEAHLRQQGSPLLIEIDGVGYLPREIEVHHLNGVKDDNRIENLQALRRSDHSRATATERWRRSA